MPPRCDRPLGLPPVVRMPGPVPFMPTALARETPIGPGEFPRPFAIRPTAGRPTLVRVVTRVLSRARCGQADREGRATTIAGADHLEMSAETRATNGA